MTDLLRPIEILRPQRLEFGAGLVGTVGVWAKERGLSRTLVVADAFNAARVCGGKARPAPMCCSPRARWTPMARSSTTRGTSR